MLNWGQEGPDKGGNSMSDYQYDNQTVKGFIVSSIFWEWSGS